MKVTTSALASMLLVSRGRDAARDADDESVHIICRFEALKRYFDAKDAWEDIEQLARFPVDAPKFKSEGR